MPSDIRVVDPRDLRLPSSRLEGADLLKLHHQIAQLCDRSPDVRFGQLLAHLGFLAEDRGSPGLWEVKDGDLLASMEQHLHELSQCPQPVAEQRHAAEPK